MFEFGKDLRRRLIAEKPAATRDGPRLMIQNDIGTNDAHVLVIQVDTSGATPVTTLTDSAMTLMLKKNATSPWTMTRRRIGRAEIVTSET